MSIAVKLGFILTKPKMVADGTIRQVKTVSVSSY